jgi:hypothetical protein
MATTEAVRAVVVSSGPRHLHVRLDYKISGLLPYSELTDYSRALASAAQRKYAEKQVRLSCH